MGVLSLLLAHGADPTLQDHHGRDPYRVALRNNNAAVAGDDGEDDDDDEHEYGADDGDIDHHSNQIDIRIDFIPGLLEKHMKRLSDYRGELSARYL